MVIESPRLRLEEITRDEARRIQARPPLTGEARPSRWGPGFPLAGTQVAVGIMLRQMDEGTYREGYGVYEIVAKKSGFVVGDIGFHGPPDETGSVEIGYGVAVVCRRKGVATEAAVALSRWALAQSWVAVVRARTEVANAASLGVLRRAGFAEEGLSEGERLFSLTAAGGRLPVPDEALSWVTLSV